MTSRYNDPELHLVMWRADERALLDRIEISRQLAGRPSETARLRAATLRSVGAMLIRLGLWLTKLRAAGALDVSGSATPFS